MGLYRRKNSKKWYVSYTCDGRNFDESTGTSDKATAQEIWRRLEAKIALNVWHPETRKSEGQTIRMAEVIDKYMADVSPMTPGSHPRSQQIVAHLKDYFGDALLKDVGTPRISDYKTMRLKTVCRGRKISPDTVRKELGLLRTIFNTAINQWELCEKNPVGVVIGSLPEEVKRVRIVTPEEADKLKFTLPAWLKPLVVVGCQTGLRRENLVHLAVAELDFDGNRIVVTKTKSGKPIGITMTALVKDVLQRIFKERKISSPYIFTDEQGKPYSLHRVSMAFKRAAVKAGIPDLHWHDLRHDFATLMLKKTKNLVDVQHACGHSDPRMTMRYAHLLPEDLKESYDAIDNLGTAAIING